VACYRTRWRNKPELIDKPNQTKPNQTKPNQTKPNQTKPNLLCAPEIAMTANMLSSAPSDLGHCSILKEKRELFAI
jgi:hypothetical protein